MAAAGLALAPSFAVELSVAGVGQAGVVAGDVELGVTAAGTQEGYVIVRVDGAFVEAQAPPFRFVWNSRQVADGAHEIAALEINAKGEVVDTVTQNVTVQNVAQVQGPVTIAYKFQPGAKHTYVVTGRSDIVELGQEDSHEFVPFDLYQAYAAALSLVVVDEVETGGAVKRTFQDCVVDFPDRVSRLLGTTKPTTVRVDAKGAIAGKVAPGGAFAAPWVPLAGTPVQSGGTWSGPMEIAVEFQDGATQTVTAQHQLVGFATEAGQACAVVKSTFTTRAPVSINMGGVAETFSDVRLQGERKTYISVDGGYVTRVEEKITGEFGVASADFGVYGTAGPRVPGAPLAERRAVPAELDLMLSIEFVSQVKP